MSQHHDDHKQSNGHMSNTTRSASLLLSLGALAGVLIWAKLRLVTDIPRSAYADPREVELPENPDEEVAPDADSDETGIDDQQPITEP
jgi:hypothetical protein